MLDQNKIKYLFGGPYDDNSTKSQFNQPGGFREKEFHISLLSSFIFKGFRRDMSESDCCLMPTQQYFSYMMAKTN